MANNLNNIFVCSSFLLFHLLKLGLVCSHHIINNFSYHYIVTVVQFFKKDKKYLNHNGSNRNRTYVTSHMRRVPDRSAILPLAMGIIFTFKRVNNSTTAIIFFQTERPHSGFFSPKCGLSGALYLRRSSGIRATFWTHGNHGSFCYDWCGFNMGHSEHHYDLLYFNPQRQAADV